MKLDEQCKNLLLFKAELEIICSSLVEFAQEMHWKLNAFQDKEKFKVEFEKKFNFSLFILDCIEEALTDLSYSLRNINSIKEVKLYLSDKHHVPNKPLIIYTALNECSKNYEDYEISTRTGFTKEELDAVLKEFKEKVMDKLEVKIEK